MRLPLAQLNGANESHGAKPTEDMWSLFGIGFSATFEITYQVPLEAILVGTILHSFFFRFSLPRLFS